MSMFKSIETQTIKTNGRVNAHDDKFEEITKETDKKFGTINKFIWTVTGAGGVLLLLPTLQAIVDKILN